MASAGFEPANLGTKGQHATPRPPKPPATVVTNNQIHILLIQEATNKDPAVVELILGNLKFYAANMYLDIAGKLDNDINLINDIL
jgi:hypothetical protein